MEPELIDVVAELMDHPRLNSDPTELDEEPGVDFGNFLMLKDQIVQLEAALLQQQEEGGGMTATQLNKVQMHLSSLTTLLAILKSLIDRETIMTEAHPEADIDPERLCVYLDLFHRLTAILKHFGTLHQAQLDQWNSLTNNHNNLHNHNHSDDDVRLNPHMAEFLQDDGLLEGLPFDRYHMMVEGGGIGGGGGGKMVEKEKVEKYADGALVPGPHEEPDLPVEEMECPICYGDFVVPEDKERIGGWGEIHRLCRCHHTYCQECLFTYVKTAIMEGEVQKILCPDQDCGEEIPTEELEWICGEELFGKYQKFLLLQELRADPRTRWCPTPGCENGVCYKEEEGRKLLCPNCENHFCGECSLPWHENSCKAALKKQKKNKGKTRRGDKWIKKNSKPCPKCGIAIVKQSGCNHMTCNNCRYEFCWVCMEEFQSYSHYSSGKCKGKMYYSNPVKKAAVYTGIGLGVALAFCVVAPVALAALPFYGAYVIIRKI